MQPAMTYKRKFLKTHNITVEEFEKQYIAFMETAPREQDYREFANKWGIDILEGLGNSHAEAVLSVSLNVVKILSGSEEEARKEILGLMNELKD